MEERNLELDDDGRIKLKKTGEALASAEEAEGDELLIEVPDLEEFRGEDGKVGLSDEELAAKAKEREERAAAKKARAAALLAEADGLFDAGDLLGAGEKYLDSAAEDPSLWRAWFGVVRVQTEDLTDFHAVYDCQKAYERAFRRMSGEERAALAERYVPSLEGMIAENEKEIEKLTAEDEASRAASRGEKQAAYKKGGVRFALFAALFVLFAAAGGALSAFIRSVPGNQILIPAVLCIAAAVVLLFVTAWAAKGFFAAKSAYGAALRPGSSAAGKKAAELREYDELIASVIDDLRAEKK